MFSSKLNDDDLPQEKRSVLGSRVYEYMYSPAESFPKLSRSACCVGCANQCNRQEKINLKKSYSWKEINETIFVSKGYNCVCRSIYLIYKKDIKQNINVKVIYCISLYEQKR